MISVLKVFYWDDIPVRKYNKIKRGAPNWAPLSHKAPQCGAFRGLDKVHLLRVLMENRCTLVGRKDGIEVSFHIGVRIVVVRLLLGHSTGVRIAEILFFFCGPNSHKAPPCVKRIPVQSRIHDYTGILHARNRSRLDLTHLLTLFISFPCLRVTENGNDWQRLSTNKKTRESFG